MSRVSRSLKITWGIIKALVGLVIAFVMGFLLWRIASSGNPRSMSVLTPGENICQAYEQNGNELALFTQEQNSITRAENNYGYFSVTDHVLIPDANQLQLVFRYNNSTIRALAEDYGLAETPPRDAELYDVTLLLAIDLTPENTEDNDGNDPESVRFVRVFASEAPTSDTTTLYNFRRFVFDIGESGEDLKSLMESGTLLAIYADVYYNQDIDYKKMPYGVLCLYDYQTETEEVKLTGKDRKALERFARP